MSSPSSWPDNDLPHHHHHHAPLMPFIQSPWTIGLCSHVVANGVFHRWNSFACWAARFTSHRPCSLTVSNSFGIVTKHHDLIYPKHSQTMPNKSNSNPDQSQKTNIKLNTSGFHLVWHSWLSEHPKMSRTGQSTIPNTNAWGNATQTYPNHELTSGFPLPVVDSCTVCIVSSVNLNMMLPCATLPCLRPGPNIKEINTKPQRSSSIKT